MNLKLKIHRDFTVWFNGAEEGPFAVCTPFLTTHLLEAAIDDRPPIQVPKA